VTERRRVLIFGNSGSGKSTRALALAAEHGLVHLDLDTIVWEPGKIAIVRPPEAIEASLEEFLAGHDQWVIEGAYGELVELAAGRCTELIFLNPGPEACLANNRRRAWEPHKYESKAKQDSMLEVLQAWVEEYYLRDGSWSLMAHRRIFDAHRGTKTEVTTTG